MQKRRNPFMLLFIILAVVMTSAVRTTPVYADDGGTEPVPEETAVPAGEDGTAVVEEPATEVPEQLPEPRQVLRCRDEAQLPDPRFDQCRQRVIDHRLVIDRLKLLARYKR